MMMTWQVAADREKALRERIGIAEAETKTRAEAAAAEARAEAEAALAEQARLREQLAALELAAATPMMSGAPLAASISEEAAGAVDVGGGLSSPFAFVARLMACTPSRSGGRHSVLRSQAEPDETIDGVANQLRFEASPGEAFETPAKG